MVRAPNGALAEMHLENFMECDKVCYHPQVRLRCDTSPDQIRYVSAKETVE